MTAMRVTTSLFVSILTVLLVVAGCSSGSDGADGAPGEPGGGTDDDLVSGEDPPGVRLEILSVSGATGPGASFRAGDQLTVTFRLRKDDDSAWDLDEFDFGRAQVAGPTFNYQRVLPEQDNVIARATFLGGARWSYTFAALLPATYAAPYNDSPSFDASDGELTGQALLDGTYTVGMSLGWRFTVDGEPGKVDLGEDTFELLVGGSASLAPRAVTQVENCNQCHGDLRYHDGERGDLTQCFMCHTSGAEDSNDPAVGGGTPGVSIESRVMGHMIHNGRHQPSVLGIGVAMNGDLDYTVTPKPLLHANGQGELIDHSWVGFPAFPNRLMARDKNVGYSALSADAQDKEDLVLTGVIDCAVCHGDPDGAGPLTAPTDGDLIYAQPRRSACALSPATVSVTLSTSSWWRAQASPASSNARPSPWPRASGATPMKSM